VWDYFPDYEHGFRSEGGDKKSLPGRTLGLYRWLGESKDVQQFRYEELRREIAIGIQQADRGELAPLNMGAVKADIHQRLKKQADAFGVSHHSGTSRSRRDRFSNC